MTDEANPGAANAALNTPPAPPPFFDSFQDADTKAWAAQGGFASAEDVAQRARKFDAFKDADPATLAVLPKADDFNAQVEFARERFGAPKEAAAYGLDKIEGVDASLAGAAQEWFHEAGLTQLQAKHIAAKQMEHAKAQSDAMVKEEKAAGEREITAVKEGWGVEATAKLEIATRGKKYAMAKLGITDADIDYLESGVGAGNTVKLFNLLGSFVKEGDFIDGEQRDPPVNDMAKRWYGDSPANNGG